MWSSTTVNKPRALQAKALAPALTGGLRGESPFLKSIEHDVRTPPPQLPITSAAADRMEEGPYRSDHQLDRNKGHRFITDDGLSSAVLGSNTWKPTIPNCDRVVPSRKIQKSSKRNLKARRTLGTFSKKVVKSSDLQGSEACRQKLVKEALRNLEFSSRSTKKFTVSDELSESLRLGADGAYVQKSMSQMNVNNKTPNVAMKTAPCAPLPCRKLLAITDNLNDSFQAEGEIHDEATTSISSSPDAENTQLTMREIDFEEADMDRCETHKGTFARLRKTLQEAATNVLPDAKTGSHILRGAEVLKSLMDRLHFANEDKRRSNLPPRKLGRMPGNTASFSRGECSKVGRTEPLYESCEFKSNELMVYSNPMAHDREIQIWEIDELPCKDQLQDFTKDDALPSCDQADKPLEIDVLPRSQPESHAEFQGFQTKVNILHDSFELLSPKIETLAPATFESSIELLSPEPETGNLDHMLFELPQTSVKTLTQEDRLKSILGSSPTFKPFQSESLEGMFTDLHAEALKGIEAPRASHDNERKMVGKWDGDLNDDLWEREMTTVLSSSGTEYLDDPWSSPGSRDSDMLHDAPFSKFDVVDSGTIVDNGEPSIIGCDWEPDLDHISSSPGSRDGDMLNDSPFSNFDIADSGTVVENAKPSIFGCDWEPDLDHIFSSPGSRDGDMLNDSPFSKFDIVDSGTVVENAKPSIFGCDWDADLDHISSSPETHPCSFQKNPPFGKFDSLSSYPVLGFGGVLVGTGGNTWNLGYALADIQTIGRFELVTRARPLGNLIECDTGTEV